MMICAIFCVSLTSAQTSAQETTCERCALPDGAMRLSPAGARACLAAERTAKRVEEALRAARAAKAEADLTRGRLAESRDQLRRAERQAEDRARLNAILTQERGALRRQRWYAAGAGAGATALVVLALVLAVR